MKKYICLALVALFGTASVSTIVAPAHEHKDHKHEHDKHHPKHGGDASGAAPHAGGAAAEPTGATAKGSKR